MKKTKNIVLSVSGLIGGIIIIFDYITTSKICLLFRQSNGVDFECMNKVFNTAMIFYIFPFVFLFSFITHFLKEEIFHSWIKFTYVWVPLSMFLVFIIPGGGGNGAFPSLIDNQLIAILMSALFVIISLIMIVWLSIKFYWFKK